MTCIAYRDGIIAADTQITLGGNERLTGHKIIRVAERFVYAFAGYVDDEPRFINFLLGKVKRRPKFKADVEILIARDRRVFLIIGTDPDMLDVTDQIIGIGDGGQYARGAMSAGAPPRDAVRIAALYCTTVNARVDTYDVSTDEITEAKYGAA